MERQRNGGGGNRQRGPGSIDLSSCNAAPPAPKSPLSKLVAEGYPHGQQASATAHQPYGERPSSGSGPGGLQHKPNSRGSHGTPGFNNNGGAGFDGNVASQWSNNLQRDVQNRQNRHDPSVAGPHIQAGGQRVTQAPGGASAIDLSWGGSAGHAPPRMPSHGTPQGAVASYAGNQYGQAAPFPQDSHRHPQRGMSPASRGGSGGGVPWGRDDNYTAQQQSRARQVQSAPFGTDANIPSAGAGSRGQPRSPCGAGAPGYGNADLPAGGQRGRGGLGGRPPGGQSQIVFG